MCTTQPNEIWHVDTTIIRPVDGARVFLHAVIDNYSRRILGWRVLDHFQPGVTARLLLDASQARNSETPTVVVDGGIENYNAAVDELVKSDVLKRVLAQTEIRYSSSIKKLVAFYVEQHNHHLLHSAFEGQTPDEMYFGTGSEIPKKLELARLAARQSRLRVNRALTCHKCEGLASIES